MINEARHAIFLGLRIDVITILLEPLGVRSSLLEVKFTGVNDFRKVDIALNCFDNFSPRVELSNRCFDSLFLIISNEVALIH